MSKKINRSREHIISFRVNEKEKELLERKKRNRVSWRRNEIDWNKLWTKKNWNKYKPDGTKN